MFKFSSLLAAALLATRVAGHGAVTSYVINGAFYPGYEGFSPAQSPPTIEWQWPDYNPTLDPSLPGIRCNGGTSAPLYATVPAGSQVTAQWAQWTHAQGSVSTYLFKCAGAFSACTGDGAGWFKIDEAGLLSGTMYNGIWGAGLVMDKLEWTSTIPPQLEPGNYLIRYELLAEHQANAPQFYAECGQIAITGSGTSYPTSDYLVSIPGYCALSDSNVSIDIYANAAMTVTSWDVPGPPVWGGYGYSGGPVDQPTVPKPTTTWTGGAAITNGPSTTPKPNSSTSSAAPPPTSSSKPASSSSSSKPATSSTSSTKPVTTSSTKTSSASGAGQTLYGQCGGTGWAGPFTCASGTCKVSNAYYSQCLPS